MKPVSTPDKPEDDFDNQSSATMRDEPASLTTPGRERLKKTDKWCALPDEVDIDVEPEDPTQPDDNRPR